MDQDFITELDAALSNVGSDVVWRKTIGDTELWISPLQLIGQEKVADIITKMDLGANIVSESKRTTLSHAIVGIGEIDLCQYRNGSAVFPVSGKDGKTVKTTLDKYLYHKLGTWGAQFVDDVFLVYADLMETFQKDNLKDVKFENAKDIREELAELQVRVYEIREQLNMPPLVEGTGIPDSDLETDQEPNQDNQDDEEASEDAFDPFAIVEQNKRVAQHFEARKAQTATPTAPTPTIPTESPVPNGAAAQRAREASEIERSFPQPGELAPTPAPPIIEQPIRQDVIDRPASKEPVEPPVIDRTNMSVNPRFRPPPR